MSKSSPATAWVEGGDGLARIGRDRRRRWGAVRRGDVCNAAIGAAVGAAVAVGRSRRSGPSVPPWPPVPRSCATLGGRGAVGTGVGLREAVRPRVSRRRLRRRACRSAKRLRRRLAHPRSGIGCDRDQRERREDPDHTMTHHDAAHYASRVPTWHDPLYEVRAADQPVHLAGRRNRHRSDAGARRARGRRRRLRLHLGDGPLLPDPRPRPARGADARGHDGARLHGGAHRAGAASASWSAASTTGRRGCGSRRTTTLDVLSGGRAWFGIGAAWNVHESKGLGFPFPPLGERFEWLEDTLRMAHGMWSGGSGSGRGLRGHALHRHAPHQLAAGDQPAAGADPGRRRRGAEDAAPGGAVRRRLQHLRSLAGVRRAPSSPCCASTASGSAAPTTRSSAPS